MFLSGCGPKCLAGRAAARMEEAVVAAPSQCSRGRKRKAWEACESVTRETTWRSHMAQPGTWGCELTLLGASHVMRRPVRAITDSEAEDEQAYTRLLTPPPCINESLWGQEVVVCVSMDRHFDATEPL